MALGTVAHGRQGTLSVLLLRGPMLLLLRGPMLLLFTHARTHARTRTHTRTHTRTRTQPEKPDPPEARSSGSQILRKPDPPEARSSGSQILRKPDPPFLDFYILAKLTIDISR